MRRQDELQSLCRVEEFCACGEVVGTLRHGGA